MKQLQQPKHESERVFLDMLFEAGVQPNWTWEDTMRAVINHPNYRILATAKERKDAFSRYPDYKKGKDKEDRMQSLARKRQLFEKLISQHPRITPYTKWKKVEIILDREGYGFEDFADARERQRIYEDFMKEKRNEVKNREWEERKVRMDRLSKILKSIPEINLSNRWRDALGMVERHPDFAAIKGLERVDILVEYEEYIKGLEREHQGRVREAKGKIYRQERINRDNFKTVIENLVNTGKIHAKSKWIDVYPLIKDKPAFLDMLGQSGSTPLDLFRDRVEELDDILYEQRKAVMDFMDKEGIKVTSMEEFMESVIAKGPFDGISEKNQQLIFEKLQRAEKRAKKQLKSVGDS